MSLKQEILHRPCLSFDYVHVNQKSIQLKVARRYKTFFFNRADTFMSTEAAKRTKALLAIALCAARRHYAQIVYVMPDADLRQSFLLSLTEYLCVFLPIVLRFQNEVFGFEM
jgi:hypothetical protein